MTRTQIQLPDDVYDRARKICRSREISLAHQARYTLDSLPNKVLAREYQLAVPKLKRLETKLSATRR